MQYIFQMDKTITDLQNRLSDTNKQIADVENRLSDSEKQVARVTEELLVVKKSESDLKTIENNRNHE